MGDTLRMRKRKEWLYAQDPNCKHCGRLMYLNSRGENLKEYRPDLATIQHLNNRYHPEVRLAPQTPEEQKKAWETRAGRTELWCAECNNKDQMEETKRLPIEELWRRSGHLPLINTKEEHEKV
ncbi:MAG: hypothetical protein KCHDKBKB_00627 [Elusimicrobia bacterium]|nr:hypothetical protein [Elusimicrobiota bacterium]